MYPPTNSLRPKPNPEPAPTQTLGLTQGREVTSPVRVSEGDGTPEVDNPLMLQRAACPQALCFIIGKTARAEKLGRVKTRSSSRRALLSKPSGEPVGRLYCTQLTNILPQDSDDGEVVKNSDDAPSIRTTKWRVENSWGDADKEKGFLMMTDAWFSEFVFEVVVDKKYVPAALLAVEDQEPTVLPAWDPMGALASPL